MKPIYETFLWLLPLAAACSGSGTQPATSPTPSSVATVIVGPPVNTLFLGKSVQLTAFVYDANGTQLSGRQITWSSSNPTVASVDVAGLVTGISAGEKTAISATSEGKVGTAQVTVVLATIPLHTILVTGGLPSEFLHLVFTSLNSPAIWDYALPLGTSCWSFTAEDPVKVAVWYDSPPYYTSIFDQTIITLASQPFWSITIPPNPAAHSGVLAGEGVITCPNGVHSVP